MNRKSKSLGINALLAEKATSKSLQRRTSKPQDIPQFIISDGKTLIEDYSRMEKLFHPDQSQIHATAQIVCEGANYISKSVTFDLAKNSRLHIINCHLTKLHIEIDETGSLTLKKIRCIPTYDAAQKQKDIIQVPSKHHSELVLIKLESNRNKLIGIRTILGQKTRLPHAEGSKMEMITRFSHLTLRDCQIEGPVSLTGSYILKGMRFTSTEPVHLIHDIAHGENAIAQAGFINIEAETDNLLNILPSTSIPLDSTYIKADEDEVTRCTGYPDRYREIDEEHRVAMKDLSRNDKIQYILAYCDYKPDDEDEEDEEDEDEDENNIDSFFSPSIEKIT